MAEKSNERRDVEVKNDGKRTDELEGSNERGDGGPGETAIPMSRSAFLKQGVLDFGARSVERADPTRPVPSWENDRNTIAKQNTSIP